MSAQTRICQFSANGNNIIEADYPKGCEIVYNNKKYVFYEGIFNVYKMTGA
jgi:hypothetical protein